MGLFQALDIHAISLLAKNLSLKQKPGMTPDKSSRRSGGVCLASHPPLSIDIGFEDPNLDEIREFHRL